MLSQHLLEGGYLMHIYCVRETDGYLRYVVEDFLFS